MKKRKETDTVIFHHSLSDVGDVERIRKWHIERGFADIGYHFVITRYGEIQHGRDTVYIGAHAKGRNHNSIGVCLIGDFRYYSPEREQLLACEKIYHDLCRAYSCILGVSFHRGVDDKNPCPGRMLKRKEFITELYKANPFLQMI